MRQSFLTRVHNYYDSLESRIGYRVFLGGTRHYGYYETEDAWPWPINPALRRMERRLLLALGCKEGDRVLDAGCGVGHVAIFMARNGRIQIEAIDVTPHHVVKATRNVSAAGLEKQIGVREADYHHLKAFEDDSFDGVYTMETFVHAREPLEVLQEFHRVLKPGGRIAMNEYDHEGPNEHNQEFIRHLTILNEVTGMPGFQSFQTNDIKHLLEATGFENVKQEDLTKNVTPMLWLFYIFAIIPFMILRLFGLQWQFPNTAAGAIGYAARKHTRYVQLSANKPASNTSRGI